MTHQPRPGQTALPTPEAWPCSSEGCPEPAAYATTFHGQAGHVHDCVRHTAVLREWNDVASVVPLPCPHPHGAVTWVDTPRPLEDADGCRPPAAYPDPDRRPTPMIETYAMDENGDLVITWEAETPEEMAELAVQAQAAHAAGLADGEELTVWADDEELTVTGGTEEQPYAPVTVAASAAHTDLVATHLAEIRRQERARAAAIVRAWLAPPGADLDADAADLIRRIHGEQP